MCRWSLCDSLCECATHGWGEKRPNRETETEKGTEDSLQAAVGRRRNAIRFRLVQSVHSHCAPRSSLSDYRESTTDARCAASWKDRCNRSNYLERLLPSDLRAALLQHLLQYPLTTDARKRRKIYVVSCGYPGNCTMWYFFWIRRY